MDVDVKPAVKSANGRVCEILDSDEDAPMASGSKLRDSAISLGSSPAAGSQSRPGQKKDKAAVIDLTLSDDDDDDAAGSAAPAPYASGSGAGQKRPRVGDDDEDDDYAYRPPQRARF